MDRSEKVAAARRKLKKFQKRSKSGIPTGSAESSPQVSRKDKSEDAKNDVDHSNAKAPRLVLDVCQKALSIEGLLSVHARGDEGESFCLINIVGKL
jgi:hypothetical protein